jgi:hypothetical protein
MHGMAADAQFRLEPWDERGLTLERRANTAVMKAYLGGIEADETMIARHERILAFGWAGTAVARVHGAGEPAVHEHRHRGEAETAPATFTSAG